MRPPGERDPETLEGCQHFRFAGETLTLFLRELAEELHRTGADFDSVWESRDVVIRERECAKQTSHAQWADLERIASLCGRTADEHPLQAVKRVVGERDEARWRSRQACQRLVAEIGAEGPMDVNEAAQRAATEIARLRARVQELERRADCAGGVAELDRHLAHHHRYNDAFTEAISEGASIEDAHAIAARARKGNPT
jgi:hypothetical protein